MHTALIINITNFQWSTYSLVIKNIVFLPSSAGSWRSAHTTCCQPVSAASSAKRSSFLSVKCYFLSSKAASKYPARTKVPFLVTVFFLLCGGFLTNAVEAGLQYPVMACNCSLSRIHAHCLEVACIHTQIQTHLHTYTFTHTHVLREMRLAHNRRISLICVSRSNLCVRM